MIKSTKENIKIEKTVISIGTTFNYEIPLKEQLPLIKKAGFTHISLGGSDLEHSRYLTQDGQRNIAKLVSNEGLKVCSVHAPFLRKDADLSSPDRKLSSKSLQILKRGIDAARYLGAKVIVFHPSPWTADMPDLDKSDERKQILVEQVFKLIDYVDSNDIKIAVENLPSAIVNDLLSFSLDNVKNDNFGFCYDSSHDNLVSHPFEILRNYKNRLLTTHISDSRGQKDDHMLPFEGNIHWDEFCKLFGQVDFRGVFLLEVEMRESAFKVPTEFLIEARSRGLKLLKQSSK